MLLNCLDLDVDGAIDADFKILFDEEVVSLKLDLYLSSRGVFYLPDNCHSRSVFKNYPKNTLRI